MYRLIQVDFLRESGHSRSTVLAHRGAIDSFISSVIYNGEGCKEKGRSEKGRSANEKQRKYKGIIARHIQSTSILLFFLLKKLRESKYTRNMVSDQRCRFNSNFIATSDNISLFFSIDCQLTLKRRIYSKKGVEWLKYKTCSLY